MILIALGLILTQSSPLEPTQRFPREGDPWSVAFLPGGQRMFLDEMRENGYSVASIVDIATGQAVLRIDKSEKGAVGYFTLSHDGSTFAGIAGGVYLTAWDSLTGRKLLEIFPAGTITRPALSPDGKTITYSNPKGGAVPLYDVGTGKKLRMLPQDIMEGCDSPLAFSPDGKYLVQAGDHEPAVIWDVASGRRVGSVSGPNVTRGPVFSPDGDILVLFAKGDKRLKAYRLADRAEVHVFREDESEVIGVSFSPDSRLVAIETLNDGIKIREIASGTEAVRIATSSRAPAFSPDSSALAACTKSEFLLWRLIPDGALEITEDERTGLWNELALRDAGTAYPALGRLARGGSTIADYLCRRLLDPSMDGPRLRALVNALASDDVEEREKAALEAADSAHEPALWATLENHSSAEVKARAKSIAEEQRAAVLRSASLLRRHRAVWVLERMGAQDALAEIARGDSRARQTIDAKAALQRLKPR